MKKKRTLRITSKPLDTPQHGQNREIFIKRTVYQFKNRKEGWVTGTRPSSLTTVRRINLMHLQVLTLIWKVEDCPRATQAIRLEDCHKIGHSFRKEDLKMTRWLSIQAASVAQSMNDEKRTRATRAMSPLAKVKQTPSSRTFLWKNTSARNMSARSFQFSISGPISSCTVQHPSGTFHYSSLKWLSTPRPSKRSFKQTWEAKKDCLRLRQKRSMTSLFFRKNKSEFKIWLLQRPFS